MGFASSKACGTVWQIALSWNATTGRSTGLIEGLSPNRAEELLELLNLNSQNLDHPLVLPEILLHMLTAHLNERSRVPLEEEFYALESLTGLTSAPSPINTEWYLGFDDFKSITGTAYKTLTRMVFLTRRFRMLVSFAQRLQYLLAELKGERFENEHLVPMLERTYHQWNQRLLNRVAVLEAYEHQTECVQKRIANLNIRLETVLSQMNTQKQSQIATINLSIAQAVRSDSIPVRTIAYVTLVLLPGAIVSSIFGMNFFQFDEGSGTVLVARTFWWYWAVTIPVTLGVVGLWNVWNFREKRRGLGKEM
ncbi:hypothetical protein M011DRAFT_446485 [Sporormia fimetaria CBS 119925]|uniref:Mg2+ transporter protein n=1 Tax=Sporormia fimetaria CBS 119925 TaxID=1340428 RepID=A0A6A6V991_9PLEO|nr:hypothetical protein M011DRAFT_446485 [Sporormia fimetaria CBS 119925]